jgi:hypothetical protein
MDGLLEDWKAKIHDDTALCREKKAPPPRLRIAVT